MAVITFYIAIADSLGILILVYSNSEFLSVYPASWLGYCLFILPLVQITLSSFLSNIILGAIRFYFTFMCVLVLLMSVLEYSHIFKFWYYFVFLFYIIVNFLRSQVLSVSRIFIGRALEPKIYKKKFNLFLACGCITVLASLQIIQLLKSLTGINTMPFFLIGFSLMLISIQ